MSIATRKLFAVGALVEWESSCDGGFVIENASGRDAGAFVVPGPTVGSPLLALLFLAGVGVIAGSSAVSVSSEFFAVALFGALGKIWAKHKSEMTIVHRHIIALP
jgi:hypothetical protein